MPKLGESITEGTIVSWSVQVGDVIKEDDVLFEVNTAKVSAEIPSPVAGKIVEILFQEGDTVAVGTVVAVVDMGGDDEVSESPPVRRKAPRSLRRIMLRPMLRPRRGNCLRRKPPSRKMSAGILRWFSNWRAKPGYCKRSWIRFRVQAIRGV